MSDLSLYLESAENSEVAALLRAQYAQAASGGTVRCQCGLNRALTMAFRCLYCGIWFCFSCAESHFGETFRQRLAKRNPVTDAAAEIA